MDINPKDAAIEYEQLKIKQREIEERLEILHPIVSSIIPEGQNVMMKEGYFYIQPRREWKFSENVKQAEKNLKTLKENEKADGTATYKESPTLYYRSGTPEEHEVKE